MKIAAFGEVMLRLSPPEHLLLEQTHTLRMSYTGTGVNLLSNLAHFGLEAYLVTTLPDNRLGLAAKAELKQLGLQLPFVKAAHEHIGTYFAEMGYGARPTQVTYQNRHNSSFGISDDTSYDFTTLLETVDVVHICGISLSLTDQTRQAAQNLAKQAAAKGKQVCFDFNFRASLNQEMDKLSLMRQQYQAILPYCQVVFGSQRDLVELLGLKPNPTLEGAAQEIELVQRFMMEYGIEWFAGTKRGHKESQKSLGGIIYTATGVFESPIYPVEVLDRIGTGDAYAAGVLLGYMEHWDLGQTVEFATANAVLAHTIQGDVPLTTREDVYHMLKHPEVDLIR